MRQHQQTLTVRTEGKGLQDITGLVREVLDVADVSLGTCTVFVLHASASLVIQENADPSVQRDLESFLARLVPEDDSVYTHDAEGPDDMPSHIRAALTLTSVTIPILDGELRLGPWQGIQLWEHRRHGKARKIAVHVVGD